MIKNFLSFDKLIGTTLIKVLYYLGLAAIVLFFLGGLLAGLGGMRHSFIGGLSGIVLALISGLLGVVFWRFMCEIYMLFFRMSDDLRDIKNHQLGIKANDKDVDIDL